MGKVGKSKEKWGKVARCGYLWEIVGQVGKVAKSGYMWEIVLATYNHLTT